MAIATIVQGMPYGPDIKRLQEVWPITALSEGTVIEHEKLSKALGVEKGCQRYYGVINAWMSRVKNETGIVLLWDAGQGVKVVDPAEQFQYREKRLRQKGRQFGRSVNEFKWVPRNRLDSIGQQRYDHVVGNAARLKAAMDTGMREIATELSPIKSLPKPKVIREQTA